MIKLKNGTIYSDAFQKGLTVLAESESDEISGQVIYDIMQLTKQITVKFDDYVSVRDKLFREYGTTEDGIKWTFAGENQKIIQDKLKEISDVEVEVAGNKIVYSDAFHLSPANMMAIEDLLDLSVFENKLM